MVYIKRLELTNFKSFGGTTRIPLLPEFTVVSGPNGSGKSNILDALLFCLGLSSSKGMRAERLPDLVNNAQTNRTSTVEASVTVTFDLEDEAFLLSNTENSETPDIPEPNEAIAPPIEETDTDWDLSDSENAEELPDLDALPPTPEAPTVNAQEWSVTRKLRVTKQGTYTSTYYINGIACTLTELHEQLNRLRIYPEGYNVVLQGDVTSIISMNPRERREIIDELAGVAAFDRKIVLAKEKLNEVKEREDRFRMVEQELVGQKERLSQDRLKAEKYQKLRAELQQKEVWEAVVSFRQLKQQAWQLREQIEQGDRSHTEMSEQLATLNTEIEQASTNLEQLNTQVKALGESELLAVQSTLATQEAEQRQLQQRQTELETSARTSSVHIAQIELEIQSHWQTQQELREEQTKVTAAIDQRQATRDEAKQTLIEQREAANAIAASAEEWVQQQTTLHRQIETLQQTLDPQRTEQALLQQRITQLESSIQENNQRSQASAQELAHKQAELAQIESRAATSGQQVLSLTQALASAEQELQVQQETQSRLLKEQREKQRELDKLEAQAQAIQEAQGTYATKLILQTGLPGICGLVAQLGRVEPRYQLALETAAGSRLGNLVVEDDGVAAAAIALLKEKRAGRATFLPLNKIRPPRFSPAAELRYANGFIDYAVNLIEFEDRYEQIFAYVFGHTVVFEALDAARRYLGQYRIVTLDGEILEPTGAMTGGASNQRPTLHFGIGSSGGEESRAIASLEQRLTEIERILERCAIAISQGSATVKQRNSELAEAKQQQREHQLQLKQLQSEIQKLQTQLTQVQSQLEKSTAELTTARTRLATLNAELPSQEVQLQQWREELAELEQSQTHSEWQQMQVTIRAQEALLQERETALRSAEQQLQELENQYQRLQEKIQQGHRRLHEYQTQQTASQDGLNLISQKLSAIAAKISETKAALLELEAKLGTEKQLRDRAEARLRELHLNKQQLEWQQQKLQETQLSRREQLSNFQTQLEAQQAELPDPLPQVPPDVEIEQLQKEVRSLQKRLQAMEPVNMLALEEYDRTQNRLEELQTKLATLEAERTELLLRIENFTTLRFRAFKEAFDAVNENFQAIFAELSDGDGYLQLDDPEDPFISGLNLVAHPKGKPVQRLASMSGGEKSLTALSFIFSLQRYRPSPFYAFDEVDMFLDGANVERLAKMIKQQAKQAQFLVVSLRRPMIESAERTIGVTQARGAYTQVLGLKLQSQNSSV